MNFRLKKLCVMNILIVLGTGTYSFSEEIESIYIDRLPSGEAKISNILIDSNDGSVIGVPQTSLIDIEGVATGESEGVAGGVNQPPLPGSCAPHCYSNGTGMLYLSGTDLDDAAGSLTASWTLWFGGFGISPTMDNSYAVPLNSTNFEDAFTHSYGPGDIGTPHSVGYVEVRDPSGNVTPYGACTCIIEP